MSFQKTRQVNSVQGYEKEVSREAGMGTLEAAAVESRRVQSLSAAGPSKRKSCQGDPDTRVPASTGQSKRQRPYDHEQMYGGQYYVQYEGYDYATSPTTDAVALHFNCPECAAARKANSFAAGSSLTNCKAASMDEFWQRYTVTGHVLGSGQFGVVRECTDRYTGERLACKSILKAIPNQPPQEQPQLHRPLFQAPGVGPNSEVPQHVQEAQREATLLARLAGHQGVVQIRGLFEGMDEICLVMELCEGGDLFDEVLRRQRFGEQDAACILAQIAEAIAACHAENICHRDLKPENILLTRDAEGHLQAKVSDFGLAKEVNDGQTMKGMAGSPFYMAPEVLDREYDKRVDLWSLGVILYILLCGSPPFWGPSDDSVFAAIRTGEVQISAHPWDCVSADAKDLVLRLLSKDPDARPSAVAVLAHPWIQRNASYNREIGYTQRPAGMVPSSSPSFGFCPAALLQEALMELVHQGTAVAG